MRIEPGAYKVRLTEGGPWYMGCYSCEMGWLIPPWDGVIPVEWERLDIEFTEGDAR